MVAFGKANLMKLGDVELRGDYDDDVAIFYGTNRLYLKRHIIRALHEAQEQLEPMLGRQAIAQLFRPPSPAA